MYGCVVMYIWVEVDCVTYLHLYAYSQIMLMCAYVDECIHTLKT